MMRTIVLGAGVAGLTAAGEEEKRGNEVIVVDAYDRVGGNHISHTIGPYTFDIGSFFFFPGFPIFTEFPMVQERCVPLPMAMQRIAPDGSIRRYPIEDSEILGLPPHSLARAILSLAVGRLRVRPPRNVDDITTRLIGRWLTNQLGLSNYVTRFYGIPPEQVDPLFADKRMGQLVKAANLSSIVNRVGRHLRPARKRPPERPADVGYVRPVAGFEEFYEPIRAELEARGIAFRLGEPVERLEKRNGRFRLQTGQSELEADRLICTIPVSQLMALLGTDNGRMKSSTLISLFVSFDGERGFDAAVLYNFQSRGLWKRLTMHSDAYGLRDGRSYFSVEVTCVDKHLNEDPKNHFVDFREHVQGSGLFRGDLRLEGTAITDHAYPMYEVGVRDEIARARQLAEEAGIILVGRQGLHDYLPTSRHVSAQVKEELAKVYSRKLS